MKGVRATILLACAALAACTYPPYEVTQIDAAPPDADPAVAILEGYDDEVVEFAAAHGLDQAWVDWMLDRKDAWARAYVEGRTRSSAKVEVRYEAPMTYDPPWSSEDEHMAALELMAELQYPGWDFTFRPAPYPEADRVAWLGHSGTSFAGSGEVYLVFETIFAHEFGHTVGIWHHYCGNSTDHCPEAYPPGEDPCIMNRNGYSFGPTEQFLLLLDGRRDDADIRAALGDILDRYPANKRSRASPEETGMPKP